MSFLESLLPTQGLYCVVGIPATGGPRHFWCETVEQARRQLDAVDKSMSQAYIAQASFKADTISRSAVNAAYLRNFFLDIDCGEGKPYATQKDGVVALVTFCKVAKLPLPSVVNSGNGLYAQWRLEADMPAVLWHAAAQKLQKVVKYHAPGLDNDSLASDMARILRPVGTHNKKKGGMKPVKLVAPAEVFNTYKLVTLIQDAFVATGEKLAVPRKVDTTNDFLAGIYDEVPSSALQIAEKCAQIAHIKAIKGNVQEPYWYAVVGLLRYTQESPEIVHEWSMGHTGYSAEETDRKIAQHVKANIGPTTCAKLSGENPQLCKGCPFVGKITTPLVLGRAEPKALAKTEMDYPEPAKPFRITEQGVVALFEGEALTVYQYPLWVSAINYDYFGESVTITHRMPFSGYKDVTVASSKITEPKTFFAALISEHIHVIGKEQKGRFLMYIETFMDKLRKQQKVSKLSGQMGWNVEDSGELSFIHGAEIYHRGGVVQKVGYSSSATEFVRVLRQVGDVNKWAEVTKILNRPGLEPLAFGFLCAAFGSPLVRFSGYEGVMVSEVGGSGLGKTLIGRLGLSAWGESRALMLDPDDTKNAIAGRFGVYNNLPAYIDEISNIDPMPLSDLAYKITRGRDKLRMTRNAVEKSNVNQWSLIGLVSSNHSLVEKLSNLKGDAGAEVNRIFEYDITGGITAEEGKLIYDALNNNYGVAGKVYAQYLVEKQEVLAENLRKISEMFARDCASPPDERFWTMTGAVAMYGGLIAQELGICGIDVKRLRLWIIEAVKSMRNYKNDSTFDPISFLGALLDRHSNSTVVVETWNPEDPRIQPALKEPRLHLVARHELENDRLWISYDTIKAELHRIHISSKKLAASLKERGLLVGTSRITLGRGTLHGSIAQLCWEFDLRHPELQKLRQVAIVAATKREN